MTTDRELTRLRLLSQGIGEATGLYPAASGDAHHVVRRFLAMQGQDFPGAVASIALRTGTSAETVTRAFDAGAIVRAYPMRGTVFVMAAEDARWVSQLCNAGVVRSARNRSHRLGLEDHHFTLARDVLEAHAADGLPRGELFALWERAGVSPAEGRGYHLLVHFLSTGVAVYGSFNGKDTNVHPADRWLPAGTDLDARFNGDREAAAAEVLRRYATSHGPVTLRDLAWWTKLPLRLLRAARELVTGLESGHLTDRATEEQLWRPGLLEDAARLGRTLDRPLLLPAFDEIVLGYPDRTYIVPAAHHDALVPGNNGIFRSSAVAGAQVVGFWRRGGSPARRTLALEPFGTLSETRRRQFERRFDAYPFLGE